MALVQGFKNLFRTAQYRLSIWLLRYYWIPRADVESYRREIDSMMYEYEAMALKALGEYVEMKAHCEAWSKAHPGNPNALLYLSIALMALGQNEASREVMDRARRNPRFNQLYPHVQIPEGKK